jgi:DNA polymerase
MTKKNLAEALQFYIDNDLNEVISEKSQNYFQHFQQKIAVKKVAEEKKSPIFNTFIKPQFSTDQALSILAKKLVTSEKFQSLNEIVAKANSLAQAAKTIDALRKAVENFDGCNLKKMATNTVFADGNPNSKIMVIGEAPGNHEDLQGIPFCDDSGQMLNDMLGAINLTRQESFYVTNVIFWRPPGNRRPTDEELAICRPFVERHIQLINPDVLLLVGATSMSAVLGVNDPISKVRGQFIDFSPKFLSRTIKTFTIFHPSYLMRQPSKKKVAWQDMLALEELLK